MKGKKKRGSNLFVLSFVSSGNTFVCISFVAKGPFWYYVIRNHWKLESGRAQTENSAAFVLLSCVRECEESIEEHTSYNCTSFTQ